jgi:hypothetical protein
MRALAALIAMPEKPPIIEYSDKPRRKFLLPLWLDVLLFALFLLASFGIASIWFIQR